MTLTQAKRVAALWNACRPVDSHTKAEVFTGDLDGDFLVFGCDVETGAIVCSLAEFAHIRS